MDPVNIYLVSQPETFKGLSDKLGAQTHRENNLNVISDQQLVNASSYYISSLLFRKKLVHRLTENSPKNDVQLNNDLHPQAKLLLSHIKDPLWKKICFEVGKMMGTFAVQKIWNSKLGSFCPEDNVVDLCCPSEETAQFINQYSFLILGSLQHYFPAIKTLKTNVSYVN
jgi:hypothetical protein